MYFKIFFNDGSFKIGEFDGNYCNALDYAEEHANGRQFVIEEHEEGEEEE